MGVSPAIVRVRLFSPSPEKALSQDPSNATLYSQVPAGMVNVLSNTPSWPSTGASCDSVQAGIQSSVQPTSDCKLPTSATVV